MTPKQRLMKSLLINQAEPEKTAVVGKVLKFGGKLLNPLNYPSHIGKITGWSSGIGSRIMKPVASGAAKTTAGLAAAPLAPLWWVAKKKPLTTAFTGHAAYTAGKKAKSVGGMSKRRRLY